MFKVIGTGDAVADQYLSLETIFPGGCCVNFAAFAADQGVSSAFMGVFGDDEPADMMIRALKKKNVDISRCRQYPGENGRCQVRLEDGERVFVKSNRMGQLRHHPLKLDADDLEYLNGFDLIHVSCFSFMDENMPALKKLKPFVSYDFASKMNEDQFRAACPYIDFAAVSGGSLGEEERIKTAEKLHGLGCPMVLVTAGEEGAMLSADGKIYKQKARRIKALDTLGAGDAFIATFLINYLGGELRDLGEDERIGLSLERASDYSASVCMTHGAFGMGEHYTNTELETV